MKITLITLLAVCFIFSGIDDSVAQNPDYDDYRNAALPYSVHSSAVPQQTNPPQYQSNQYPQTQYPDAPIHSIPGNGQPVAVNDPDASRYDEPHYHPPQNHHPQNHHPAGPYHPQHSGPVLPYHSPGKPISLSPTFKKTASPRNNKSLEKKIKPEKIAIPDVTWYEPHYWCGPCWKGSFEAGINGSTGNSESINYRFGAKIKRKTELNQLAFDLTYSRNSSESIETQHNALGNVRFDKYFVESRWQLFWIGNLEYDEFKAFDLRLATSAGLGYRLVKTDFLEWVGRVGSGVSHEIGGPDDSYVPEAVLGIDIEYQLSQRQKILVKADYLPEWGDFDNYRLTTEASWEVLLDYESNLSLKLAVIDRYDSTPNGRKPNDLDYTLLLMWKL